MTGGAVAWLSTLLGYDSVEHAYQALGSLSTRIGPGADGVIFHTSFTGERFPTWSTDRAASITGLRPEHTAAHLLRSAEEGGAFTVREGLDALTSLGVEVGEIRIAGGVTKRKETMRLRANVWQKPVLGVSNPEATTIGAALLACVCGGVYHDVQQAAASMVLLDDAIDPDRSMAHAYEQAYAGWQAART
jgi:sugar (pentulose or hexulose) kinase